MLKRSASLLKLIAILGFVAHFTVGCGGPTQAKITAQPPGTGPGTEKVVDKDSEVSTMHDQLVLALTEIGWNRLSVDRAIHPPISKVDGCQTFASHPAFPRFLAVNYKCSRTSDKGETAGRTVQFLGNLFFDKKAAGEIYVHSDDLIVRSLDADNNVTRNAIINHDLSLRPTSTTIIGVDGKTTYVRDPALNAASTGEFTSAEMSGAFTVATSDQVPAFLMQGSTLIFAHTPETPKNAKMATQTLTLTAITDIAFETNLNCLHPVGTFAWTVMKGVETSSGILTSTKIGYSRNDEPGVTHAWGRRCTDR